MFRTEIAQLTHTCAGERHILDRQLGERAPAGGVADCSGEVYLVLVRRRWTCGLFFGERSFGTEVEALLLEADRYAHVLKKHEDFAASAVQDMIWDKK